MQRGKPTRLLQAAGKPEVIRKTAVDMDDVKLRLFPIKPAYCGITKAQAITNRFGLGVRQQADNVRTVVDIESTLSAICVR
jgi:hypothetical protein